MVTNSLSTVLKVISLLSISAIAFSRPLKNLSLSMGLSIYLKHQGPLRHQDIYGKQL